MPSNRKKYYIQLISPHGLIRGREPEIGRDTDTGGQVRYVLELLRALGDHPRVRKVDLLTRLIDDKRVSKDYAQPVETIAKNARIVRIPCSGRQYRRKEQLWPTLDEFVDKTIRRIKEEGDVPDVFHGHYADGGYIAMHLANLFGGLLISTGHSLGRNKLRVLRDAGMPDAEIDRRFNINHRIDVEESILRAADRVIASTQHEIATHYCYYESKDTPEFKVIPPGIDTETFYPYYRDGMPHASKDIEREQAFHRVEREVSRFLYDPGKPLILSIGRPNRRKNFELLLQAFGEDKELQTLANLAIFAGIRKDITQMPEDEREVLTNLLLLMDKYDLYGTLAIPKKNDPRTEIPAIYRLAAWRRGVFINASPGENFGLTLIEASACGLPIIAAPDGGPGEIVEKCRNGFLVDVNKPEEIAAPIKQLLLDRELWQNYSESGVRAVDKHFTWPAHVETYLAELDQMSREVPAQLAAQAESVELSNVIGRRISSIDRFFITDIDGTLIDEDNQYLPELKQLLLEHRNDLIFGVATGRNPDLTAAALEQFEIPHPDIIICSTGTEILYARRQLRDAGWEQHISHRWDPEKLAQTLKAIPQLRLQEQEAQRPYKLSYYVSEEFTDDTLAQIHQLLDEQRLRATVIYSDNVFLDFIPYRASKGKALRYLSYKWNTPLHHFLACGNSGNDEEMLRGDVCAVVVGNYSAELEPLKKNRKVYFAGKHAAGGILEGLRYFQFLDHGGA